MSRSSHSSVLILVLNLLSLAAIGRSSSQCGSSNAKRTYLNLVVIIIIVCFLASANVSLEVDCYESKILFKYNWKGGHDLSYVYGPNPTCYLSNGTKVGACM